MFIKGTSGVGSHPKLHTYEEGYLLPVLTADELLFGHRHKGLLRQFRDLAELPSDDFDRSYGALIKNFMEFTQILPHKTSGIMGSLLNYGLARTAAVFQKYCQLRKTQTTPLLKFAVFSAALLKDVGRVLSNQRIVMVDETGEFHRDWNPFSGSMIGQTQFYKMYPISATYLRIESEATPMLARQLIPHDIFLWLSSDLSIFSDWLAALLGEEGVGSKEITLAIALIKREDIIAILNTLDGALVDPHESMATEHGEAFYKWLKEGIENGTIKVNTDDADVHVLPEGVFINEGIFKKYAAIFKVPIHIMIIYAQFGNLMGIVAKGANDHLFHMLYGKPVSNFTSFTGGGLASQGGSTQKGMLITDPGRIFINTEIPAVSTTLKTTGSTTPSNYQFPVKTDLNAKIIPTTTSK